MRFLNNLTMFGFAQIAEMLRQGSSPGRYAAMLRNLLRKMSRDDAQVGPLYACITSY